MKILKLSPYYEPEQISSSHLTKDLEEAYISAGFEIEIFAPTPTRGVSKSIHKEYKKIKYEEKYDGKIKIYRFNMLREGRNPIQRAIRYILCNVVQYYKAIKSKDVDIIIAGSTPPTQGLLVTLVNKKLNVPIVYSLQDIFPDSLVNTGLTKENSLLWKIGRLIENYTYKNVDKIIVISEDFKKNIMAKGVNEEKIEVIYNWVNENEVINVDRERNKLFDKYNLDRSKFYITHCGNIGFTQNMDMLLDVAKGLECNNDIQFLLIGDGAYRKELENQITKNKITNVKIIPFQPYEDISFVFSLGDVGLVISKESIGQNSVPSKTWSIMSAHRPLLASFDIDSQLSSIINKSNSGICVQAGQKEKLIQAILYLYNNKSEATKMGINGRKYIMDNLTKEIGTSKYVNVLKAICNG